jgi:hypothetical protein
VVDPSLYSFEIVDLRPQDAEDRQVTIQYETALSKEGRKEMEYRVDAWCSAVQTGMFSDVGDIATRHCIVKQWWLLERRDDGFRPDRIVCRLEDACLDDRDFEGLLKMLHNYNLMSGGRGQSVTRLEEHRIVRVTIE